jgi:hypothetical protein
MADVSFASLSYLVAFPNTHQFYKNSIVPPPPSHVSTNLLWRQANKQVDSSDMPKKAEYSEIIRTDAERQRSEEGMKQGGAAGRDAVASGDPSRLSSPIEPHNPKEFDTANPRGRYQKNEA